MIGSKFKNLQIEAELGRGGMSTVYRARDVALDRLVALKIAHSFVAPDSQDHFNRHMRAAARLEHPHILPIYDYGIWEGQVYFVVRYLQGRSLKEILTSVGTLQLNDISYFMRQLGSAIDYAHGQGAIHGDIKPLNIMFDSDGNAFLTDFGIPQALASESGGLTSTGMTIGTPGYMAPEMATGEKTNTATDLYALGVITFEAATGRWPYESETSMGVLLKHLSDPVPSARALNTNLPQPFDAIIQRALAKKPEDRYQNGTELASALNAIAPGMRPGPALKGDRVVTLPPQPSYPNPLNEPPLDDEDTGFTGPQPAYKPSPPASSKPKPAAQKSGTPPVKTPAGSRNNPPVTQTASKPTPPRPQVEAMKIFISYRKLNRSYTDQLVNMLKEQNAEHDIWFDTELSGGYKWWSTILDHLESADLIIAVLTKDYLESVPCQLEFTYADKLNKRVMPVLFEPVNLLSLPASLVNIQYVDLVNRKADAPVRWQQYELDFNMSRLPAARPKPPEGSVERPAEPISELNTIRERLDAATLSSADQHEIGSRLQVFLKKGNDEEKQTARDLMTKLGARGDLLADVKEMIVDPALKQPLFKRFFKRR